MNGSKPKCTFTAITLFPEIFDCLKTEGVVARGCAQYLIQIKTVQLRDFATDERKSVDTSPAGGGDGMVLRADIAARALESVALPTSTIILLSPSGKVFNNKIAQNLAKNEDIIFLCGRYSGFDYRLSKKYECLELSLGDYVLSGGELPAMCLMDSIARFVPGVLGNEESALKDSFEDGLLEAPAYGKPLNFNDFLIPAVFLSGNHKKIKEYSRRQQVILTAKNRPDLILLHWESLTQSEKSLAEKIWKHGGTYDQ